MATLSVISHLDFATATIKKAPEAARVFLNLEHFYHRYPKCRRWEFLGKYRGKAATAGERGGGGLASGCAGDGSGIVQVWGKDTESVVQMVLELGGANFTRLDIAVTVLHDEAQRPVKDLLPILPTDKYLFSIVQPANEEGGTLYVGSRRSEMFARLYDKGVELRTLPGRLLWRYEVEMKGSHARQAVQELFVNCQVPSERVHIIFENVRHFFVEHGVPFPAVQAAAKQYPVVQYESRVADDATTIRWLSTQVYPALLRLENNGKLQQALEALRVDQLGNPLRKFSQGEMDAAQGHFLDKIQYPMHD